MRWMAALAGVLIAGCGSNGRERPRADVGIVTITQIDEDVAAAARQLEITVEALAKVVELRGPEMPVNHNRFRAELITLDAFVKPLRDRATSVPPRRDEYLLHWVQQTTSAVRSRNLGEEIAARKTQLMPEFVNLSRKGVELKNVFAAVHATVQDCARFLETELTEASGKALTEVLAQIRAGTRQVDALAAEYRKSLGAIKDKLNAPLRKD